MPQRPGRALPDMFIHPMLFVCAACHAVAVLGSSYDLASLRSQEFTGLGYKIFRLLHLLKVQRNPCQTVGQFRSTNIS